MTYRNPYAPPPDYETIASNVMQADPLAQLAENVRRVRARSAELLQRSTATLQANADYRPDLPQSVPWATMVGQGLSQDIYNNAHPGAVGRSLPRQINSAPPPDGYADGGPVRAYDSFVRGLRDPIDDGAQFLTTHLPQGFVNAGNRLNNMLADSTGLVGHLPDGGVAQQVRDGEASYQAKRQAAGSSGIDGWRMGGNMFSPVNLVTPTRLPAASSMVGRVAKGAMGTLAPNALMAMLMEYQRQGN